MKFEFTADKWHFLLETVPDPNYMPDSKFLSPEPEELDSWRSGKSLFFQLIITSTLLKPQEDSSSAATAKMKHYLAGVLLPTEEAEAQEELEFILDQEEILEHIIKHWELEQESVGPSWRGP